MVYRTIVTILLFALAVSGLTACATSSGSGSSSGVQVTLRSVDPLPTRSRAEIIATVTAAADRISTLEPVQTQVAEVEATQVALADTLAAVQATAAEAESRISTLEAAAADAVQADAQADAAEAEAEIIDTSSLTPVDPASVQVGRWTWTSFTTAAETYPPVQLWLDVAEGGAVNGLLSVYPAAAELPEAARTPVQLNGCNVEIESLDADTLTGAFYGVTEAFAEISVTECSVKFFGNVTLTEPLHGTFLLEYNDAVTQALLNPEEVVLTPIEQGRQVFSLYCSACHGSYGEGMSDTPGLNTAEVQDKSDEELREIVTNGILNTEMPAWGGVLTAEQMDGVLELVRNIGILESGG